jgi:adenosylhomocysteine nucleosidase
VTSHLGILAGLQSEARCLSGSGHTIALSGARLDGARRAAQRLITGGATHLLSFGLAGGLDPALAPGALLLPSHLLLPGGGSVAVDPDWHGRALNLLAALRPHTRPMVGTDRAIVSAAAKAALFDQTGAGAVDMESHVLAETGPTLPLLIVRVIVDGAQHGLPPAALAAVRPDGTTSLLGVLTSLVRQPGQLPRLLQLGREAQAGERTLRAAVALGAPSGFGLADRTAGTRGTS